jgi:solute carrier family 25 oxoglutarate transporter 11
MSNDSKGNNDHRQVSVSSQKQQPEGGAKEGLKGRHDTSLSHKLQPFVVGGASAMFASSCIHPIDLAKVRLQLFKTVNPGQRLPNTFSILSNLIKENGFFSIYSGLTASLLRQAVYGTARIGLHRSFSEILQDKNNGEPLSFGMKTLSGMTAGAIAVCLGTPCDVALVRMQADSMKEKSKRRGYKNAVNAIIRIGREEGIPKLFSGIFPNVLRGMAMNVGMLACYDEAKELIGHEIFHERSENPSLETQVLASLVAGFTASAFSLPFDLLKSRSRKLAYYS